MSKDDRWCTGIALHDFAINNVKWQQWFDYNLAIFTKHGLQPTRIGMQGKYYGHSVKTLTFKGGYKKLLTHDFAGLENLGFMAMQKKDDFTSNFIIDVSLYPNPEESRRSNISIAIDEKLQPFTKEQIEQIAHDLQQFTKAKYGYYYHRHLKNSPDTYCMGGAGSAINNEEKERNRKWTYRCSRNYHTKAYEGPYYTGNIRDIYKLNFLSQENLAWQVIEQQSLQQWILASPSHGKLKQLSTDFWSWLVADELIASVRKALLPSGIIICT